MTDQTNKAHLESCPFCGGKAHFDHDDDGWQWISCEECDVSTNSRVSLMEDCKPLLAEAWNRRASAPAAGSVPEAVLRAVKRMSQPLDASRLSGATAMADASDMNLIAAFINSLTTPAAGSDMVQCGCGDGYPADSYEAGFIDGKGHCENCDAGKPAAENVDHD